MIVHAGSDFGKMLKERRTTIPLTLRELAAKSGVSAAYLGRIERGARFPSAHILQKIAKPLGYEEGELFTHAGYLSPQASTTESETGGGAEVDPYVARILAQEPIEVQRTVLGILTILKSLAIGNPAKWPEFREYFRRKYPNLDEDLITMIEGLIERKRTRANGGNRA
jgi:transcriptional regulator with XRE-family HTH domain